MCKFFRYLVGHLKMKKEYCCPICGNINVRPVDKNQVYCPNCYECIDCVRLKEVSE